MRVLGVELSKDSPVEPAGHYLVLLDGDGAVERSEWVSSLPEVAATVARLVGDDAFLLGVDIPVVVPARAAKTRGVESLVRRRFGYRLPPGGRTAETRGQGVAGEALLAGLGAAGLPCLPYPDRDRRQNGLAETHPELILKSLLWESSPVVASHDQLDREELFRAYAPPPYRRAKLPAKAGWAHQAVSLELVLRALGPVDGLDQRAVETELTRAASDRDVEQVAALLDATLIAYTAQRYLDHPEASLFLGERDAGYVILPADGFIRRVAAGDAGPAAGALFPHGSLRERLGPGAKLRAADLLQVPGRPQRVEATFKSAPRYEFDNVDEMLWWKHCRHLDGPHLPTQGLHAMVVRVSSAELRLVRSRHRTLSFRFDPPAGWRKRVPTRDGKTYPFEVLRAVYETSPAHE